MTEFSDTGKLKVKFSNTMRKITELSTIDSTALKLKLYPHETSTHRSKEELEFDWKVTEFGSNYMILQIDWNYPIQISSGLQRDKLQMTVLNNWVFFSA